MEKWVGKECKEYFCQKISTTPPWKSEIHTDKILVSGNSRWIRFTYLLYYWT